MNWGPVIWIAAAANILAGLWFSPLTEVRRLRILGAPDWDRGRLVQSAQTLQDRPGLSLNPRQFESKLLEHRALADADFRRSLFGAATLRLAYRTPLAQVEGCRDTYLGREGVLFPSPARTEGLPTIRLHVSALKPGLALAGGWPSQRIAGLIEKIPLSRHEKLRIEVDSEGAICLNTAEGARIQLGGADRLEEKIKTLEGLIRDKPGLLRNVIELNLTEPTRPAWKSRPGANP